jgi:hypothetical protein
MIPSNPDPGVAMVPLLRTIQSMAYRPNRVVGSNRPVEWGLFLTAIAMLAMIVWGQLRVTGPVALLALTLVARSMDAIDRATATRRIGVLAVTVVVAYLLRNYAPSLVAHRVGRLSLVTGVGLAVLLSFPSELLARIRDLHGRLARAPRSRAATLVAIFGVALPAAYFYSTTTRHVWTGDTMPLVPTVVRMATHGDRELTEFLPGAGMYRWDACGPERPYFVREVPGRSGVYSTYPAGMEAFVWPTVLVLRIIGIDLVNDELHLQIEKWTASLLAGASLALFYLIALHLGSPAGALAITGLLATGSVFASTLGMLVWQQGGIVFWMLLALTVEFRTDGRPGWRGLLLQALACGWILACRPSAVTFLVPFGLWVMARDWHRGLLLPLLALVAYSPWAVTYWSIYRNPFGPSMGFLGESWTVGEHMLGVLFSPGRGLFVFQPFLFLAFLFPFVKSSENARTPAGWMSCMLGVVGLHLLLIGSWPIWWGGFCYGSRLVAEVVPLLAFFAVRPAGRLLERPRGWLVLAILAAIGLAIHTPCLYHDAWLWNAYPVSADAHPERMWDWRHPPFLYGLVPNP